MSEAAVSYAFEQLAPSDPVSADSLAQLVVQATAEAGEIRARAREEGYADGQEAGRNDGLAEVRSATAALGEALGEVKGSSDELAVALERDAIELALALASKILAGALQAKPELVVEVVRGALRRLADRRHVTLLVNPADLEAVRLAVGAPRSPDDRTEVCDVQADQRVPPGGAIARTAEGEVDASVQTQLERAREVMFAELDTGEPAA